MLQYCFRVGTTFDLLPAEIVKGEQVKQQSIEFGGSMKLTQSNDDRQIKLTFAGQLDLPHANQAHQALAEAIRHYVEVAVQVGQIDAIDLSFLQLVCAAHRTAISQQKCFTLTLEDNDQLRNLLTVSGFKHHCGCGADAGEPCIWQTAVFCQSPPVQGHMPDLAATERG